MSCKPKIFVSYTTRDGKVTELFLRKLEKALTSHSLVYIDLIHNNSKNKQNRVIEELKKSDLLFLIKTEESNSSNWVNKELQLANKLNIPIIEIDFEEISNINFQHITSVKRK